ncbi:MAG: ATP-binding cassette domain-containing protein [Armatimonadia bacterium]|nr:ATP-binding cassette domain-containing protein [Armatimonadia bacterium]
MLFGKREDGPDSQQGASLLELREAWKVYDLGEVEVSALRGISLTIERGSYVSIMGPSGSGKSTMLNLLGCLDRPTRGDVLMNGTSIADLEDDELAEIRLRTMGFVFQSFHLLARRSALQNVMLPLVYAGRGRDMDKAVWALERVGLGDRIEHLPNQLSGGQAQRVAIARAIVNDPEIILADEPTGALDTKSGAQILETLEELNSQGITVILVTHEPHIGQRASRVLRFLDGEIVADARGEAVSSVATAVHGT